jgi:hypothetical protein
MRNTVSRMLDQLFLRCAGKCSRHGSKISMCIGASGTSWPSARGQTGVLDARWSRKLLDRGRIIHAEEIGDDLPRGAHAQGA